MRTFLFGAALYWIYRLARRGYCRHCGERFVGFSVKKACEYCGGLQ